MLSFFISAGVNEINCPDATAGTRRLAADHSGIETGRADLYCTEPVALSSHAANRHVLSGQRLEPTPEHGKERLRHQVSRMHLTNANA